MIPGMEMGPFPSRFACGELRVVIAASEASRRRSLGESLEEEGFVVCASEDDAAGAVEATVREEPDACLVADDLAGSALVATGKIATAAPRSKVVILSASIDEEDCLKYLLVGASGYVCGDTDRPDLADAVRAVVSGRAVVPPQAQRRLLEELREQLL